MGPTRGTKRPSTTRRKELTTNNPARTREYPCREDNKPALPVWAMSNEAFIKAKNPRNSIDVAVRPIARGKYTLFGMAVLTRLWRNPSAT